MDPFWKFEVYFCLIATCCSVGIKTSFFCWKLQQGAAALTNLEGGEKKAEAHSLRSFDVFCWCDSPTRARLSRSPLHYNERCMARIKLMTDIIDVHVCVIMGLICSLQLVSESFVK